MKRGIFLFIGALLFVAATAVSAQATTIQYVVTGTLGPVESGLDLLGFNNTTFSLTASLATDQVPISTINNPNGQPGQQNTYATTATFNDSAFPNPIVTSATFQITDYTNSTQDVVVVSATVIGQPIVATALLNLTQATPGVLTTQAICPPNMPNGQCTTPGSTLSYGTSILKTTLGVTGTVTGTATVPEPASMTLLVSGLGLVGLGYRRRRRS